MARLRIVTTQELEFVRGRKVVPGTTLVDAEIVADIDSATLRVLLAQGTRMLRFQVLDAEPAEQSLHGGVGKPAPRRTPRRAAVDA